MERQIVERLRREGHRVLYVAEMDPGIGDAAVLARGRREQALLLTADKDFGELVYRQRQAMQGVVLLRLAGLTLTAKADLVVSVLAKHAQEFPSAFSVVTPGTVRIRAGA